MTNMTLTRPALAGQFLAAIDMVENAMNACPDEVWGDLSGFTQFWYLIFHTLFWLDCYLSETLEAYRPPPPFGLEEMDPAGVLPPRVYTREELGTWLVQCREKCAAKIDALTEATAAAPSGPARLGLNRLEFLLYQMRHVQHHAAQLNLILRQRIDSAPRWVGRGKGAPGAA